MRKSLISLAMWTVGLGTTALLACSAPDPGVGYLGSSYTRGIGGNSATGSDDAGSSSSTPSPTTGGGGEDSGTTPSGSGGGTGEGGAATVDGGEGSAAVTFLGETTPWASNQEPATTATQSMSAGTVVVPTPTTDCMTCHVTGGTASPFLAAGFVASTPGGTTGAANVEVRVYAQGSDAGVSGYTDSNGYFWINPPIGGLTGPYNAALRNATSMTPMPAAQTTIDCQSSSCHGGTADGNIHFP